MKNKEKKSLREKIESFGLSSKDVDLCLFYLLDRKIIDQSDIEYLINTALSSFDTDCRISVIIDRIIAAVKEGSLKRWDFDPYDIYHRDQQKSSPPTKKSAWWNFDEGCKVLGLIAEAFHGYCRSIVDACTQALSAAKDFKTVQKFKELALQSGALLLDHGRLCNNHSFPGSKEIFVAFQEAIARVP